MQILLFLLAAWFGAITPAAPAAPGDNKAAATFFARAEGSTVHAVVRIKIQPGWHLYGEVLGNANAIGKATSLEFSGDAVKWGAPRFPTPEKADQPYGQDGNPTWIYEYHGTVLIYVAGELAPGAKLGPDVGVAITGLTCEDAGLCVQYDDTPELVTPGPDDVFKDFPADLTANSVSAVASKAPDRSVSPADDGVDWASYDFKDFQAREVASQRSLGVWLFFAFIAGMLLNVMPCVLPVLSIKVLSFVQQAGESKGRVLALGLAFAAGIMVVFVGLASLAAFAGQGWGAQFSNETFKVVMVAVVFAFALSLFDLYELGVPSKVGELAAIKREGVGDAFFKGIMATVLATPCSGPFLGSTLAWALSQTALTVFAVFLTVGLGMAFPYIVLTANPKLLKFLPKPGAWMQTFKQVMGFVLLLTAVYLMVSLRQDNLIFVVLMLVFVAFGCWWWGKFATFERSTAQRMTTLVVSLAIVAFGAWFVFGWLKTSLKSEGSVAWVDFDPAELDRYREEGKPVLIDFTAAWCPNCQTNRVVVYESDRIAELLKKKGVVAVEADKTLDSPKTDAITRFHDQLGSKAIPFMAIFVPGDEWYHPYVFRDIVTRSEVADVLEKLPDASQ
jgi:thiol:disulfide interchange protein